MDESGEIVQPGTPGFLPAMEDTASRQTRLDLAHWLVDENNPLTARVFANRLWKQFFNRGLSRVLDDLGSQGEPPTHPDLLDWLAVEFMRAAGTSSTWSADRDLGNISEILGGNT